MFVWVWDEWIAPSTHVGTTVKDEKKLFSNILSLKQTKEEKNQSIFGG